MSVFFPFLPFHPEETSLSFETRLAALPTGGRLVPLLHDIGVQPMALAGGQTEAIERLCAIAGVETASVLANTASPLGKRRYALRGHEVTAEFFASPFTVFCPACLAEDDATAGGHGGARRGRFTWSLRVVRTCPRHGIALVHRAKKRWDAQFHEPPVRVPECGGALDVLAADCERRSVSPLQDYVLARLDGRSGPAWLDAQDLEQAVRATEMLGSLVEFGARAKLTEFGAAEWNRAGRGGFTFTSEGEPGIRAALHQAQTTHHGKGKPGRRKVFGRFYEWLSSTKQRKDPSDIKRIVREHIFETMEVASGKASWARRSSNAACTVSSHWLPNAASTRALYGTFWPREA